jgi:polysaccharide pyruvyl transferase CsaB
VTASQRQTVLVAGYYGFGNTGDEAILASISAGLAALAPPTRVVVVSGDPAATRAQHGVDAIPWRDVAAIARAVRESDLVIVGGGGLFQDHWGVDPGTLLTPNHYGISFYAGPAVLAALAGKPLALLAVGFGPLESAKARRMVRGVCEAASLLSVRDSRSRDLVIACGVDPSRVRLSTDAAFALPGKRLDPADLLREAGVEPRVPIVGVALRPWALGVDPEHWEKEVAGALDRLIERTRGSLVFVPFQRSSRSDEDDAGVALRVRQRLGTPERAIVLSQPRGPSETAGLLAECDLVVAMRLHAAIFAISGSTPAAAIAYDPKVEALFERAGLSTLVEPLPQLSGWSLQARMESALEGGASLRERLAAFATEQRRLVETDLAAAASLLARTEAVPPVTEAVRDLLADALDASLVSSVEASTRMEKLAAQRALEERRLAEMETAATALEAAREHHRGEEARLAQQLATTRQELHAVQSSRLWKAANLYWRARRLAARLSRPARRLLRRAAGGSPSDWVGPDSAHAAAAAAPPAALENRHDVVLFARSDADPDGEDDGGGLPALARRLATEGHRVFRISPHLRPEGGDYEIRARDRGLFSVSLRGDAFAAIDALRRDESLGATVSLVDAPSWMAVGERLRRERAWPLVTEASGPEEIAAAFPRLSVVIVTYGNRDLNRLCLDTLTARTEWPNLEILAVDNGSTDGTRELLERERERLHPRLRTILNAENRGFAAACNAGLAAATGEYLVLLNNDTVVTRGALSALVRHLSVDPALGLVGPVTNAIANEAQVEVGYSRLEALPSWAREYTRAHDRESLPMPMLALFCVAMTRAVYERIGALDERFGIGMFEDDDYSRRVREKGLSIRCARDAFVHHWQMASFRKMAQADYAALFEANRRKFAEKWGDAPSARPRTADPVRGELQRILDRAAGGPGAAVFLPSIGWGISLVQRPHHLARALAKRGYQVVFDCTNAADRVDGFHEVEPNLFLFRGSPELLHEIPSPLVWAFPYNFDAAEAYPAGARTVYDWIDELEVFPYEPAALQRSHERALKDASLVLSVARRLHERALRVRPDALYVPNGVEYRRFLEPAPRPHDEVLSRFLAGGGPVAGYYGALARWFDYELLEETSRLRPDWRFVLIGQELDSSLAGSRLLQRPNVIWLGPRDYETLPGYLATFDVAMIPFRINAITLATSPLKLYEYFAAGKPVVTTPMPECEAFAEVGIARDAREFSAALDRAREQGRDAAFRERLRALAGENSWDARIDTVLAGLASRARPEGPPATRREPGLCNICGRSTRFLGSDPKLDRESLNCEHCLSTSRYRSIARGLLEAFRRLADVDAASLADLSSRGASRRIAVYDTQTPFSTGASAYPIPELLARCPWIELHLSTHRPGEEPGRSLGQGTTNQNLERLTFPDESFDIVVTSDVMEHVRLEDDAHREIRRVLKPGGVYLFTVPHFRNCATIPRVEIVDPADPSRDRNLMEPEYHGDANSPEGRALAYRAFGIDLDEKLRGLGFSVEYTKQDFPEHGIRNTELFFCRVGSA